MCVERVRCLRQAASTAERVRQLRVSSCRRALCGLPQQLEFALICGPQQIDEYAAVWIRRERCACFIDRGINDGEVLLENADGLGRECAAALFQNRLELLYLTRVLPLDRARVRAHEP